VDNIKALACKVPILHLIDSSNDELIWVIFDASASGMVLSIDRDLIGNPADLQDLCPRKS
jgi:hypothetical protein